MTFGVSDAKVLADLGEQFQWNYTVGNLTEMSLIEYRRDRLISCSKRLAEDQCCGVMD